MTDGWDGPACPKCGARGQIVFTRGEHWISVGRVDCHGAGLADARSPEPRIRDDGFRVPENGEEYDPDAHGPIPEATWSLPWRLPYGWSRRRDDPSYAERVVVGDVCGRAGPPCAGPPYRIGGRRGRGLRVVGGLSVC